MNGVAAPATGRGETWPMYRAMVGIGLLCGLLLVLVFVATKPVIERNRAEALAHAVYDVLPGAASSRTFALGDGDRFVENEAPRPGRPVVHAGYADDGRLVGLAIEAAGMGYQDTIRLLYGYAPEQDAIIGFRVLDSKETPGLGDRIQSDRAFLDNFVRLDVGLAADGARLAHAIVAVRNGRKTDAWQIDAITGATVSSNAVANILNQSAENMIPLVHARLEDFREER